MFRPYLGSLKEAQSVVWGLVRNTPRAKIVQYSAIPPRIRDVDISFVNDVVATAGAFSQPIPS